ncbi:MHYT domain-containing protein [Pseudohalocynthiibacter sp. F2068]|jgi:NO-binding membrane sensor protein with MHYT domain|uniref:MHYT domain-containing protein n=1 Tax=Pseudohalocynthiibacter sp. F2068 TaxID=2926418 RepID=UPI001FF4392E|nr:MHYT domain-containing protein [Pseudohalocynthiibacter sp. F2068]MCK0101401.1 LytTR family transcriptional regulator DNA-binding domain-containing protein [Pseudohalocynthiibacter sp. F2068]
MHNKSEREAVLLEYSHDFRLVAASLAVSLMASFTGLALTRGISLLSETHRKQRIAMASVALGGGIWSMHFVAMLGLQMPILFYYDALLTLISALVAILMVGVALLVMHYWPRTSASVCIAGTIVGLGIPAMHYIGMLGIQLCKAVYTPVGVVLAVAASVILGIGSFSIAYGERTHRNIILSTITFGVAVFTVHFLAMAGTNFLPTLQSSNVAAGIDNSILAMIVTLISFVICGAFLLSGVTFWPNEKFLPESGYPEPKEPMLASDGSFQANGSDAAPTTFAIPYEKDSRILFAETSSVAAIRAEGHYTIVYVGLNKLFCPWSISDAAKRLAGSAFVQCHRSYLINPSHVTGFERKKDNGVCFFENNPPLGKVPVSRSRLSNVRSALGL